MILGDALTVKTKVLDTILQKFCVVFVSYVSIKLCSVWRIFVIDFLGVLALNDFSLIFFTIVRDAHYKAWTFVHYVDWNFEINLYDYVIKLSKILLWFLDFKKYKLKGKVAMLSRLLPFWGHVLWFLLFVFQM